MVDIEDIPAEVLNAATVQSSPVLAPGDIIDISVVAKNQEVVIPSDCVDTKLFYIGIRRCE